MQFDQQPDGTRKPLPKPSVDTGAGLERITSVMQAVPTDYDTDLFQPIIAQAVEVVGKPYDRGPAGAPYRVLADHARAVAFLLADGVYPSNEGRGYVLRRILRRAVRHAWVLGRREPTLAPLTRTVTDLMGHIYPELIRQQSDIEGTARAEEERFLETIEGGLWRMDELRNQSVISGEDAFKLQDTFGFPIDLTQMIAAERGQSVDLAGFERALEVQRQRSRGVVVSPGTGSATWEGHAPTVVVNRAGEWRTVKPKRKQQWVGYEVTKAETDILQFRQSGDRLELVLHENPFYAESGGQVSDTGVVKGDGWELTVEDVEKVDGKSAVVGRFGEPFEATPALAQVNEGRRRNVERNHTATHLVHAALRKILGTHVRQAGSVVAPERLRFDFSHHGPIEDDVLARIEEEVNEHIWANLLVKTREMKYKDAIAQGAMAFFTEKYGDRVRVVDIGNVSLELCGGTHVPTTGQIALFRFTHETGAAAGVRRIEAVTGPAAYRYVVELRNRFAHAASLLKTQPEHLERRLEAMLEEHKKYFARIEELLRAGGGGAEPPSVQHIGGVEFQICRLALEDKNQIATFMDSLRTKHPSAVSVILSGTPTMPSTVYVGVGDELRKHQDLKAGNIVEFISSSTGGRGGGRPHFASGSIGDPTKISSDSTFVQMLTTYFEKKK